MWQIIELLVPIFSRAVNKLLYILHGLYLGSKRGDMGGNGKKISIFSI